MAIGVQKILETLKFVKKVKLSSTFNYNIHIHFANTYVPRKYKFN